MILIIYIFSVIANHGAVKYFATAVLLDPDIISKISVYCLSGRFYKDSDIWAKDYFYANRDLNALHIVLITEGLDLHVMPVNILYHFKFTQLDIMNKFLGKGGISYLSSTS